MPSCIAILRHASFTNDRIDEEAGIIYGVKIAELGKVACFKGPDGKPRYATISSAHVDAFLSHAGNRSIPVHWTHDYRAESKDHLHAKVGCLKNLRKDEQGNPIADLYVSPGSRRNEIFWNANHDNENMMLSPVYGYDPDDSESIPLSFNAADLVEVGAATVALFSEHDDANKTNTMDKKEFIAMLGDSEVKDAFQKLFPAPAAPQTLDTAAMSKLVADQVTAELAKAETERQTKAQAAVVAQLGSNSPLQNTTKSGNEETFEAAVTAEMSSMDVPNRAKAISIVASKKPSLYNKHLAETK